MVIFSKQINIDDPRLNVLHGTCIFLFVIGFGILAIVLQLYDERVEVGPNIWTRIVLPDFTSNLRFPLLKQGFARMQNTSTCQQPQDLAFWWSDVYKYENYSCMDLCDLDALGSDCISRYEIVQAKDDLSFVLVTEIENPPLRSGLPPEFFFVAWEPETIHVQLSFGTITKDISWFSSKHKKSDERHSSNEDILTVVQDYNGDIQKLLEPAPFVDFTVAEILKWSGANIGLDVAAPGASPNVMPGAKTATVIPRISGLNIKASLECFTRPPKNHGWRKGPVCSLTFEYYAGPWVGEPYIRSISTDGRKLGSYYHGTRVTIVRSGYFSYPTAYLIYKCLVDMLVLSVWPRFFVLAVTIGILGHKSKIYDGAIRHRFDIIEEVKGTTSRLLTYSLDFAVFADEERKAVSRLVVADRLTAVVNQHKSDIDKYELLALVNFCHHAMMKSGHQDQLNSCSSFCRDVRLSFGDVPPSEIEEYYHQQTHARTGVSVSQFNMSCCSDEAIQFQDLINLFDRDRQRSRLEKIFCSSDSVVLAYRDLAEEMFDEEQEEMKSIVLGHYRISEVSRINARLKYLEDFLRARAYNFGSSSTKLAVAGPASAALRNTASLEPSASMANFQTTSTGELANSMDVAQVDRFDKDGDGKISKTELQHVKWKVVDGFIAGNHDIFAGEMTVEQAKDKCLELESHGCKGFCYEGPSLDLTPKKMYFKGGGKVNKSSTEHWTTYLIESVTKRDELLEAFKMFDRDGNSHINLAEMTSVMTTTGATCLHVAPAGTTARKEEIKTDKQAWSEACSAFITEAVAQVRKSDVIESAVREQVEAKAAAWVANIQDSGLCPDPHNGPCTPQCGEKLKNSIMRELRIGKPNKDYFAACRCFKKIVDVEKSEYTRRKRVVKVNAREGEGKRINSIQFFYSDDSVKEWGTESGNLSEAFVLEDDEYITKIVQRSGKNSFIEDTPLSMITFVTNKGNQSITYGNETSGYQSPDVEASPLRQIFALPEDRKDIIKTIRKVETRLAPKEHTTRFTRNKTAGGETLVFLIEGTILTLSVFDYEVIGSTNHQDVGTCKFRCIVDHLSFRKGRPASVTAKIKVTEVKWMMGQQNQQPLKNVKKMEELSFPDYPWDVVATLKDMAEAVDVKNDLPEVMSDTRPLTDNEVGELLSEIDADGDGNVSYEEFVSILLNEGGALGGKELFISGETMTKMRAK